MFLRPAARTCLPFKPVCHSRGLQTVAPSSSARRLPCFAFDIDGVLKQGEHVLPEAKAVLQVLSGNNKRNKTFPFILVTNGGGILESERCVKLTRELGVPIEPHQLVQSHTIFQALVKEHGDKPVLAVGGTHDKVRGIAEAYGFKEVYIPADVIAWQPSVWPFHRLTDKEKGYVKHADFNNIQFGSVLVFHDSRDWGRDVQLCSDLARAQNGVFGTVKDPEDVAAWKAQIPFHFSNPDLLWGNDFPQVRFGQGAFQESLAAVYKRTTGYELVRQTGGKPTRHTYEFAAALLENMVRGIKSEVPLQVGNVYMVGDNPESDIAGANAFGWQSLMVRTGVFRGKFNDSRHPAKKVVPNVLDAVKYALLEEGEDVF